VKCSQDSASTKSWYSGTRTYRVCGVGDVQIEALPEVENAPERKPTEEVHDQRWKARARSTSTAQAMADRSTRRTTPLRHTTRIAVASAPPPAKRAANTQIRRGKASRCDAAGW
jgi:hypothetical protein